jgi:hypothetical protein
MRQNTQSLNQRGAAQRRPPPDWNAYRIQKPLMPLAH